MHPNGNGKHTSQGKPRKLLDQVRDRVRTKHYSIRTEEAYVGWIRRFILFHNKRHPSEMGKREVESFLTHLAVNANVSASTQSQALSALLFLYRDVLEMPFPQLEDVTRAKAPQRLPVVMTSRKSAPFWITWMVSGPWLVACFMAPV